MNNSSIIKTAAMVKSGLIEQALRNVKLDPGNSPLLDLNMENISPNLAWVFSILKEPSERETINDRVSIFLQIHSSLFQENEENLNSDERNSIVNHTISTFISAFEVEKSCYA